ncbi:MAG: hypothetical protein H0T78_09365 [Longispora sp.]|nr:hypothetical protein [Longispora sp. (in: high G+C Gram-positive bacteria)]
MLGVIRRLGEPPEGLPSDLSATSRQSSRRFGGSTWSALRAAFWPWLLAHILVGLVLWWVHLTPGGLRHTGDVRPASGLFAWDSGWYRAIAEHGYDHLPEQAVRFFPLLPMTVRGLTTVTSIPSDVLLLLVSSGFGLAYGALLFSLVRRETGDTGAAHRTVWLAQLVPGANVLVLGYTEALAGFLAVAVFWWARSGRWGAVGPIGLLSGLARPTGLLLALPVAVEVFRRRPVSRALPLAVAAVLSPLVGTGAYLLWCGWRYGDALLPYSIQTRSGMRGGITVNTLPYLVKTSSHGPPWPLVMLMLSATAVLLWICVRRLPWAYCVWTIFGVAAAVTATGFHSLPRYLAGMFPLLIAAGLVLKSRRSWLLVLGACILLYIYLSFMTFTRYYIP